MRSRYYIHIFIHLLHVAISYLLYQVIDGKYNLCVYATHNIILDNISQCHSLAISKVWVQSRAPHLLDPPRTRHRNDPHQFTFSLSEISPNKLLPVILFRALFSNTQLLGKQKVILNELRRGPMQNKYFLTIPGVLKFW